MKTINIGKVKKTIKELSSKNSNGHDTISTNFLKRTADIIAEPLKLIIIQSLCTRIFPHRLKLAKVVPLLKKCDPHILDNHRPISILSAFSRVLDKIVFHQTYAYLTENKLLYSGQCGFRKARSTELASIELVDRTSKHLDSGKLPMSVFLDLSKAIDTLDQSILLTKLPHYSFKPHRWNGFIVILKIVISMLTTMEPYQRFVPLQLAFHKGPSLALCFLSFIWTIPMKPVLIPTLYYMRMIQTWSVLVFVYQLSFCQRHENGGNISKYK